MSKIYRENAEDESKLVRSAIVGLFAISTCLTLTSCKRQNEEGTSPKMRPANADDQSTFLASPATAKKTTPRQAAVPGINADDRFLASVVKKTDAKNDNWPVETFSDRASAQLSQLKTLIADPAQQNQKLWNQIFHESIELTTLRPADTECVFQDNTFEVLRLPENTSIRDQMHLGIDNLPEAFQALVTPYSDSRPEKIELKIVRVNLNGDEVSTRVVFHAFGKCERGRFEQVATWDCRWEEMNANDPRIRSIRLHAYEESTYLISADSIFTDCTSSVFENTEWFAKQLAYGVDHWRRSLEASLDPDLSGHQGISVADFNGDAIEDIYVCQQGGLPNRLFFGTTDGRLVDATRGAGVDQLELTSSALGIDLDNDGDQDLVLATITRILIFENSGAGRFRQRQAIEADATLQSMAAADYDLDGDLDIYLCGYSPGKSIWKSHQGLGAPVPYYDANNGGPSLLLRNEGKLSFVDATMEVGLDANNSRFSFAASWEDYDNDGDPDLYVANDFGRNNLYRNDRGVFKDVAAETGVEDMASGMSVTWGDYNNDGWMDLYVGNMFSSAGNRIAYQRQFLPAGENATKVMARRLARGNSLFQNGPNSKFVDVSVPAAVTRGRWAWASKFADINNDGFEDILVANGFITHNDSTDL